MHNKKANLSIKGRYGHTGPHVIGKNPSSFSFHVNTGEFVNKRANNDLNDSYFAPLDSSGMHSPCHLTHPALESSQLASPHPRQLPPSDRATASKGPAEGQPGENPSRTAKHGKESVFQN